MFCFHKWKLHSNSVSLSDYEKMKNQGFITGEANVAMFTRNRIVVLRCSKCGMIKEKIMDEDAMVMNESESFVCGSVPANNIKGE